MFADSLSFPNSTYRKREGGSPPDYAPAYHDHLTPKEFWYVVSKINVLWFYARKVFVPGQILLFSNPFKCKCCPHIETSQLICAANQLAGFYMRAKMALNGLI